MPPQDPPCPVSPGEILAEKYVVEQVLGVGGMGVVVAARHLQLDELVALKFLLPNLIENEEAVAVDGQAVGAGEMGQRGQAGPQRVVVTGPHSTPWVMAR